MSEFLVLCQLVLAAVLTGVIWQVQLLTYPQFLKVPQEAFPTYHRGHTFRMGCLVVPPMLLEISLAGWSFITDCSIWSGVGFLLVGLVWLTTALLQVPKHRRLGRGKDAAIIRALILSNWLRTVLWSVRLGWLIAWAIRIG